MTDGGYYAIKGFEFQIDKTILEILNSKNNAPVCVEQIQDINSDDFIMQIKYKETQDYSPSKIKEPLIQLINEYRNDSTKKYYLYCYFNNAKEENRILTCDELDKILGNKKDIFEKFLKDAFIDKFELHFARQFQDQFVQAVETIKVNARCSDFDEALIHYGSIATYLRKIVVNNSAIENRRCTKNEIIQLISDNRKTVFDAAYRIYQGEQQYIKTIKKYHFTYRNIDDWERFVIIELNGDETISKIKSTTLKIKGKFYKKMVSKIKSGAPYIYFRNISSENLKKLKTELLSEEHILKDGYDFLNADFQANTLKIKSTINNNVSIKFLNIENELFQILSCNLNCTKKIFQFYLTKPLEIENDIDMICVEVKNLSEIQQILS
ncbi:MAG: hypothetical protein Q8M95_07695 [Candidatus Methanoperedens sp.]|nr:hypothetical protein [Candidatus Methanoperedens sp.]